ncbi:MAG: Ig-like domain-containing protein [Methanobacteriaceae archaeon]|nr:Ig-like domain-containing protein [Methanobacteriaceae archaeon]
MKINKFLILFVVFSLALCITVMGSVSAAADGNNSTPGQSKYTGPQTNTTKWINTSMASAATTVAENGTMYVRSDSILYAINSSNMEVYWNYTLSGSKVTKPVIGPDGVIYAYSSTTLYAIYSNGTLKWEYEIPGDANQFYDPPAVGSDTIYLGAAEKILAIDSTDPNSQDPKWIFFTNTNQRSGPVLSPDEKILYFGSYGAYTFYALDTNPNATERVLWSYVTGTDYGDGGAQSAPVIGPDGTIYIGTGSHFYAFDPNPNATNHVKWNITLDYPVQQLKSPVIASDGTIYMAASSGSAGALYAFDPNATDHIKWILTLGSFGSTPVIGADGTIYLGLGNTNRSFVAVNPNGTVKWRYTIASGTAGICPDIGSDGTLYIGTTIGWYAFQDLVADFTSTSGSGLDVSFVDTSSNIPTTWIWDFGDGGEGSGDQNPTHTYSASGTYTVTLTVITDPGDSATVQKVITVNQAPTLDPIGDRTVDENKSLTFNVVGHDSVGDNLTYSATGLPAGATFNSTTGAFSWTPNFNQAGTYPITFTVSDGSLTASETITITVNDVDNVAPTVVTVDPASNKVVSGVNRAIVITFSEVIKAGSAFGSIKVTNADGVSVSPLYKVINGKTLTLTRIGNYINGLTYMVTLPTGSITDAAGNALSTFTSKFAVDNAKPTVTSVDPASNKVVSGVNRAIVITFSEAIKAGSAFSSIKVTNPDGVLVKPLYKVINGKTLTLTRIGNYINGLTYTITLPTGSITDTVGNALTTFTSKFTVDNAKPTVTSVNPVNNKVVSGVNRAIVITFSENIKAGSAFSSIKVTNADGVAVKPLYKVINGKTLTLTRNGNYINGLTYTITLSTGSITDTAGNALSTFTSKFKVDNTKPTVTSVNPANNKVINMANRAIVITFSENIKAGSAFSSIKVTNPDGVAVKPLYKVINGKTLTLTRNGNYINGLTYTITLPTGSITDAAGNAITTYTSKFTTRNT